MSSIMMKSHVQPFPSARGGNLSLRYNAVLSFQVLACYRLSVNEMSRKTFASIGVFGIFLQVEMIFTTLGPNK